MARDSQNYNDHVTFDIVDAKNGHIWDTVIAVQFVPFLLISCIGNILAFRFFISRPIKSVPTTLYIFITLIDICIGIVHLPVMGALFNHRRPWLFNFQEFCTVWAILFSFLHKFAIFLVMLLTVTRTIKIVLPFAKIQKTVVIFIVTLYGLFLIISDIAISEQGLKFVYSTDTAYCYEFHGDYHTTNVTVATVLKMANFRVIFQVGLPALLIYVSFGVSITKLYFLTPRIVRTSHRALMGAERRKKLRASVTITLFTGLFLMCNTFFFVIKSMEGVMYVLDLTYPGPFFKDSFMFWYSWILGKIYFTVLNAVLNPVLYYWRIREFRNWVSSPTEQLEEVSSSTVDRRYTTATLVNFRSSTV